MIRLEITITTCGPVDDQVAASAQKATKSLGTAEPVLLVFKSLINKNRLIVEPTVQVLLVD